MTIVIVGAGGVGFMLSNYLMDSHEVIVIDKNLQAIRDISSKLDVLAIHGDAKDLSLYENIDKNIDIFIAVTNNDDTNILVSLLIDEVLTIRKKIIRLNDDIYNLPNIKERLNLDHAIFPIKEVLSRVKRTIDYPYAQSIKSLENTNFTVSSLYLENIDEPISQEEFLASLQSNIKLCGIKRGNEFYLPSPCEMLLKNDLVYMICKIEDLQAIGDKYGPNYPNIEGCVLFGGDKLACKIANILIKRGIHVRMFEKDITLCKYAQETLGEDATIYHTKYGLDHHFNEDEMQNAQMVIATTNKDEFNLVKCLEAKYNSIPKVVAINNDPEYTSLMRNSKIEIIRGLKPSSFYSIAEKLDDINLVVTKKYCAKDATVLIKHTFGLLVATKIKDFSSKIQALGLFFILRGDEIIPIEEDASINLHDSIVACCESENTKHIKKWLDKQF